MANVLTIYSRSLSQGPAKNKSGPVAGTINFVEGEQAMTDLSQEVLLQVQTAGLALQTSPVEVVSSKDDLLWIGLQNNVGGRTGYLFASMGLGLIWLVFTLDPNYFAFVDIIKGPDRSIFHNP